MTSSSPENPTTELRYRDIFRVYYPLALSWMFMSIETPTAIWVISQLANAKVNTAAYMVMSAIAIFIESPVIDLLATSTTLAKSRQSYLAIRRFAIWMIIWVTVAHAIASMTPLYYFITRDLIGAKESVVEAARIPLILMLPWSGFIGWRRYLQGIMIRNGHTKEIGWGTVVRFATMFAVGIGLYSVSRWHNLTGVTVAAIALATSVGAESVFIHMISARIIRVAYRHDDEEQTNLSMEKVSRFHLPLTLATMVTMLNTPLVSWALSRAANSVDTMAAWQDGTILTFLFRTVTYALNEVVIALSSTAEARRKLGIFSLSVGLTMSVMAIICGLTGIDQLFFRHVLRISPDLYGLAHMALLAVAATPFVNSLVIYYRGLLTSRHVTLARVASIIASVLTLFTMLQVGVSRQFPGILVAAFALTCAMVVELIILSSVWWIYMRRGSRLESEVSAASELS